MKFQKNLIPGDQFFNLIPRDQFFWGCDESGCTEANGADDAIFGKHRLAVTMCGQRRDPRTATPKDCIENALLHRNKLIGTLGKIVLDPTIRRKHFLAIFVISSSDQSGILSVHSKYAKVLWTWPVNVSKRTVGVPIGAVARAIFVDAFKTNTPLFGSTTGYESSEASSGRTSLTPSLKISGGGCASLRF